MNRLCIDMGGEQLTGLRQPISQKPADGFIDAFLFPETEGHKLKLHLTKYLVKSCTA